jgi:single-strand DNA-binding protein
MLRVSLLGNLGADPELRYTQKGAPMVSFRVAVNFVRPGADGERQENTEWIRVRVMGRNAEFAQRLTKGSRVFVAGRLDISYYVSRDGERRPSFDVFADELQNVSGRPSTVEFEPEAEAVTSEAPPRPTANGAPATTNTEELEDLPF